MVSGKQFRILFALGILAISLICQAKERSWVEVKSPNFTVISDTSEKEARRTAHRFEQFRNAMQVMIPGHKIDSGLPFIIFFARNKDSFKKLLPYGYLQEDRILPAALFLQTPVKCYALLRADLPVDQGHHAIYHEYVHRILRQYYSHLPLWLEEGYAEFFANAEISAGRAAIGKSRQAQFYILSNRAMIPLEALFSAESDSIYSNDAFKAEMFYTQSWFLVHFFMLGDNSAHIGKLDNFIALIQQGLSNMDAARQAFGDLEKLQQDLDRYVKLSTLAYKWTQLQFDLKEKEYTAHTLSLADSLALRGTLLAEINRLDEAQDMLEQALELDSRNMTANEGMGMLCLQRKEYEKAGEYFTLAEELNSQSFLVQFHAAQSIFNQGSGDLEKAEACLRKALSINPDFVPAYYLLSHVALRQKEKLSVALVLARKAAELAPAEFHYRVHIGQVLLAMNNIEEAHSHALNLIAMAHTEPDRQAAQSFLSSVDSFRNWKSRETVNSKISVKEDQPAIEEKDQMTAEEEESLKQWEEEKLLMEEAQLPVKTGPAGEVEGVARSVQCRYPAMMDLVVDAPGKQFKLRARNYYEVQFRAVGGAGRRSYDPCTELEGEHVKIRYVTTYDQEYGGLIREVDIGK